MIRSRFFRPAFPATNITKSTGRLTPWQTLLLAMAMAAVLAASPSMAAQPEKGDPKAGGPKRPPVPVVVTQALRQDVPVMLTAVGSAQASATVKIRSRVGGELVGVHFAEGQEVRQGQLLFSIDSKPLEAALREAQAHLQRDKALLAKSQDDNRRYGELLRQKLISVEQYQQVATSLASLKATVQADEAEVENARVQLSYTSIKAPIAGRAGSLLVDRGNMVKASDDALVVLMQLDPLDVTFSVPEEHLPAIAAALKRGPLTVEAAAPKATTAPARGTLSFVDNAVDRGSGTIALKASMDNRERLLWPGQFVSVSLRVGLIKDAVTVPAAAVQAGQDGQYAYVVDQGGNAQLRTVVTGQPAGPSAFGGQDVVVRSGLAQGDRVVVDGQLRLTPGAPVEIRDPKAKADGAAKPEATSETKPEAKPEAKPEVKPEAKPEAKPGSAAKGGPAS